MITILFPALVAVVAALAYALSTNGKLVELARIAFFCGLFFVVWALAHAPFVLR
jgi:hypothetical protein